MVTVEHWYQEIKPSKIDGSEFVLTIHDILLNKN